MDANLLANKNCKPSDAFRAWLNGDIAQIQPDGDTVDMVSYPIEEAYIDGIEIDDTTSAVDLVIPSDAKITFFFHTHVLTISDAKADDAFINFWIESDDSDFDEDDADL